MSDLTLSDIDFKDKMVGSALPIIFTNLSLPDALFYKLMQVIRMWVATFFGIFLPSVENSISILIWFNVAKPI